MAHVAVKRASAILGAEVVIWLAACLIGLYGV